PGGLARAAAARLRRFESDGRRARVDGQRLGVGGRAFDPGSVRGARGLRPRRVVVCAATVRRSFAFAAAPRSARSAAGTPAAPATVGRAGRTPLARLAFVVLPRGR